MFGSFLYKDLPALRVKECYLCRYQTAVETMSFSLLEIIEVFSMFFDWLCFKTHGKHVELDLAEDNFKEGQKLIGKRMIKVKVK